MNININKQVKDQVWLITDQVKVQIYKQLNDRAYSWASDQVYIKVFSPSIIQVRNQVWNRLEESTE
jgi:hypothetical protein